MKRKIEPRFYAEIEAVIFKEVPGYGIEKIEATERVKVLEVTTDKRGQQIARCQTLYMVTTRKLVLEGKQTYEPNEGKKLHLVAAGHVFGVAAHKLEQTKV
jgi:hypothetical protein